MGDFAGLTARLDYLADLGVTAIWLLPFYPSPLRDDGYDIADYTAVHPDYGTLRDFRSFIREAHRRGLRVITELVFNHTSDQHPWFQRARRRAGRLGRARLLRLERHARPLPGGAHHLPGLRDLQLDLGPGGRRLLLAPLLQPPAGPQLRRARVSTRPCSRSSTSGWRLGVDGLRLDAIPYLYEREGTNCENLPETHAFLKRLRAPRRRALRRPHAAGRGQPVARGRRWPTSGDGDECHMAFHFPLMPRLFMALRMEDRHPDRRHPGADAGHPGRLPVGAVPAQPRRADAGDGHRRGARLHVPRLRGRPAGAHQPGHPPPPGAAAGQRPPPHRAA